MGYVQAISAAALFVFNTIAASQRPLDLIRQVAQSYRNLRSFEVEGHLITTVPGSAFQIRVEALDAEAGHSFVPENSSLLKYAEARNFRKVTITDPKGNHPGPGFLPHWAPPGRWGSFVRMDDGAKSATELPSETIEFAGASVRCRVLQVAYDPETWHPEELSVKYWIDPQRLLVLKEDFVERQGRTRQPVFWHWVFEVDSVALDQPPPQWLVESYNQPPVNHARAEWVGRIAPDFRLSDLDGRQVDLSGMRGKVVVLDFWATWCPPCREEVPIVETITNIYKTRGVEVWGISWDEESSTVKKWLANNQKNLRTLIDPDAKTSEPYEIKFIPALLVLGRRGEIVSYYQGTQSEQSLRSAIELALHEGPSNNE
jgi:peroxiredoxin